MATHVNVLTSEIIGAAIEVHRHLGPGLLESAYKKCLMRELALRGMPFKHEWPLPLEYKGIRVDSGYRLDLLVADAVVVEAKSVESLAQIHESTTHNLSEAGRVDSRLVDQLQCSCLKERHSS